MEREEAIQIDPAIVGVPRPWNGNRRPALVVGPLAIGHHDVEAVDGAALEDGNEELPAAWRGRDRPRQDRRCESKAQESQAAVTKEDAP